MTKLNYKSHKITVNEYVLDGDEKIYTYEITPFLRLIKQDVGLYLNDGIDDTELMENFDSVDDAIISAKEFIDENVEDELKKIKKDVTLKLSYKELENMIDVYEYYINHRWSCGEINESEILEKLKKLM